MPIRRINLIAGPGHRKTTSWHKIMAAMLEQGLPVEGVHEVAKPHIYRLKKRGITVVDSSTQLNIFNEQTWAETDYLNFGVTLVVNESCPFISLCHSLFSQEIYNGNYPISMATPTNEHRHADIIPEMEERLQALDAEHPALHILLSPPEDAAFSTQGRYQQSAEAKALHRFEHAEAERRYPPATILHASTNDITGILHRIRQELA